MLESWVFWSLLAATMQAVRTAGQKYLTQDISASGATLVRYLFGLPFALAYLAYLLGNRNWDLPSPDARFLTFAFLAGLLQIVATILLVRLFTLRNFAVGTCYVRTQILITALIGWLVFGEMVSLPGWAAMVTGVVGLLLSP